VTGLHIIGIMNWKSKKISNIQILNLPSG
jgi:hypothetical protein